MRRIRSNDVGGVRRWVGEKWWRDTAATTTTTKTHIGKGARQKMGRREARKSEQTRYTEREPTHLEQRHIPHRRQLRAQRVQARGGRERAHERRRGRRGAQPERDVHRFLR